MPLTITKLEPFSINSSATFTFADTSITANVTAGNIKTDNLLYSNGTPYSFGGNYSNSNVSNYLPTYTGNVSANYFIGNGSTLTNITGSNVSGNVTIAIQSHYANIANSVAGDNVSGNVNNAIQSHYANIANSVAGANVSGNVSFAVQSHYANIANSVAGANVTGYVPNATNANTAGTVTTNAQPNITSVGNLSSVTITGNLTAGNANIIGNLIAGNVSTGGSGGNLSGANFVIANYFSGNGSYLTSLTGANVSGNVNNAVQSHYANIANSVAGANVTGYVPNATNANTAGTVTTNAQPNITSLGTLSSLTVTSNVSAGNVLTNNLLYANGTAWNLGGEYSNTNVAAYLPTYTGNLTAGNANITGNLIAGNVSTTGSGGNLSGANFVIANYFSGNGSYLTSLTGANVTGYVPLATAANTAGTVTTNAQPNITSVGSLTSLVVSGDATVSGNLIVSGTTEYINVTNLYVKDPIIEMGGGANGAPLSSNDGKDRGTLLHYYTTGVVDAFMGWDNSGSEFIFGSNVSVSSEVVTVNAYGNIHANVVIANLSGTATYATTANAVAGDNVSGNVNNAVQSHYANIANSVAGANVSGQVGNALIAGTVYTNAQPNITSVGNLTSVTVTGNGSLGNLLTDGIYYANGTAWSFGGTYSNANVENYLPTYTGNVSANYFIGNGATLTYITGSNVSGNVNNAVQSNYANTANSVAGANVSGQVSNALIAGTVTTNAQPNITSVGNLSSLTINGLVSLNSIGNLYIPGGNANYVIKTDGLGNLSWHNLSYTTVDADGFTGNGIQTDFTLSTTPASANYTIVSVGGVVQPKTTYSLTGNLLSFSSAPPNTAPIEITTINTGVSVASSSSLTWNIASSNITMSSNNGYFVDTSTAAKTMTLPSSATLGDTIRINDLAGTFSTNNLTVARNGHKIQGVADDLLVDADQSSFGLVYSNSTYGWKVLEL